MKKEIIFDKILKKFEGDKSFTWKDIHKKEFYDDIDSDYYVVENHLNFLIGDNTIKEVDDSFHDTNLSLSRKGWFMMTNSKSDGYVAKRKKEQKDKSLKVILAILSIGTFILVGYRFYIDFIKPKNTTETTNQGTVSEKKNTTDSIINPFKKE